MPQEVAASLHEPPCERSELWAADPRLAPPDARQLQGLGAEGLGIGRELALADGRGRGLAACPFPWLLLGADHEAEA